MAPLLTPYNSPRVKRNVHVAVRCQASISFPQQRTVCHRRDAYCRRLIDPKRYQSLPPHTAHSADSGPVCTSGRNRTGRPSPHRYSGAIALSLSSSKLSRLTREHPHCQSLCAPHSTFPKRAVRPAKPTPHSRRLPLSKKEQQRAHIQLPHSHIRPEPKADPTPPSPPQPTRSHDTTFSISFCWSKHRHADT